jgi:hypothetical protein
LHQSIIKLLSIATDPIGDQIGGAELLDNWGSLGRELAEMLGRKNGFYAYEAALLVRPFRSHQPPLGLMEWNSPELWKAEYDDDLDRVLFFAEDVFGCQFCIRDDQICTFDPETAIFEPMSTSLVSWAGELISDYAFHTGFPLAHAWQDRNGSLQPGDRLLPATPFVCRGKFEIENLNAIGEVEGMSFRGFLANNIRDVPDGGQVLFRVE